jgi:hypothetical protein
MAQCLPDINELKSFVVIAGGNGGSQGSLIDPYGSVMTETWGFEGRVDQHPSHGKEPVP